MTTQVGDEANETEAAATSAKTGSDPVFAQAVGAPSRTASDPVFAAEAAPSLWSPLRIATFRALWFATLVSNIGTWMQDVGAAWLMTSLTTSALMVSLVQTASTLPLFALALPAGALADLLDRRRLLMATQLWMCLTAATLGAVTYLGLVEPPLLLALAASLGLGAALNAPAWQAVVPELVPRPLLPSAVTLGSIAMNASRAVGPAIGGVIVASYGPAVAFFLNAASFLVVLVVVWRWRREAPHSTLPNERFFTAIRSGLRYVRHATGFRAVLVRTAAFLFPGSAIWALLPLVARLQLGLGPGSYGAMLGAIGLGALTGSLILSRARSHLSTDVLTAAASAVLAVALIAIGLTDELAVVLGLCFLAGICWMSMLSSLTIAAQSAAAGWVRGRAMSTSLMVLFGSMALGGMTWGAVADRFGISMSLLAAGGVMLLGLLTVPRWRLQQGAGLNLEPSRHWRDPEWSLPDADDRGPVLITVEYIVRNEDAATFVELLHRLRRARLRDGAYQWGIFQDVENPHRWTECFQTESWLDHLRQHQRVTAEERGLQEKIAELTAPHVPKVSHMLAPEQSR